MIIENDVFKYIDIKNDEYILKSNVPIEIIQQIREFVENMKKIYNQNIKIKGL